MILLLICMCAYFTTHISAMDMGEQALFQIFVLQNSRQPPNDYPTTQPSFVEKKDEEPFILENKDGKSFLQLTLLEHVAEKSVIKLRGIIACNEQGQLECKIDYNHKENTYSGILINRKYDLDKKLFYPLDHKQAKYYYEQFGRHTKFGTLATP